MELAGAWPYIEPRARQVPYARARRETLSMSGMLQTSHEYQAWQKSPHPISPIPNVSTPFTAYPINLAPTIFENRHVQKSMQRHRPYFLVASFSWTNKLIYPCVDCGRGGSSGASHGGSRAPGDHVLLHKMFGLSQTPRHLNIKEITVFSGLKKPCSKAHQSSVSHQQHRHDRQSSLR